MTEQPPPTGFVHDTPRVQRMLADATDAQLEYDTTPELRDLLTRATASSTVRRTRNRRT